MTLEFTVLKSEDSGYYECIAQNRLATVTKAVKIHVTSGHLSKEIIISAVSALILLAVLSLYLLINVQRKRKLIAEFKAAGLENFEEGNLEFINTDLNLDEQADLLPYDKSFEFPRNKLEFRKQLGAGAFGVVFEAVAKGILNYEPETTVAVKMVKKQAGNEVIKALVSELKILIYLGQHLNVVNLLGAVTKNISKRELMVIFEHCRYGNLQSFLVRNRPNFIYQVKNDKIYPTVLKTGCSENSAEDYVDRYDRIPNQIMFSKDNFISYQAEIKNWSAYAIGARRVGTDPKIIPAIGLLNWKDRSSRLQQKDKNGLFL